MFASFLRPNKLSQKMMRVIFSIYLAVTCLITSMEFLTEYVKTQDSIVSELKQLKETVLHSISTSLWQYDQNQLEALVVGLLKMPIIEGVDILDKYDQPMISQRSYTTDLTPLSIFDIKSDLNWQLNEQKIFLGSLILHSSSEVVLDRVLFGFSLIIITEIIKLSVLFWLFIWAFNRYLASPLKELMSQVNEVQLSETITKRINLSHIENNELIELQAHMNNMLSAMARDREILLEDEQAKRNSLERAVAKRTQALQTLNKKLKVLATRDSLTDTLNRGSFFETAQHLLLLCQRQKSPTSFILMDLDHFKSINDTYGHVIGDKVLIHFTQTIQTFLRKSDLIGRVGGEEFAIYLADIDIDDAFKLADKIRETIANSSLEIDGKRIIYTVSLGVVSSEPTEHLIVDLFKRADVKLYGAKGKGRNYVER
ncbi:diguanylate cyclase [Colwellia sp. MB3u-70]|uniref:GGDEF domain-containing protein n=1 Tax=unclassified Colwellia TaxID=196834 RepID=UPI0015F73237|nr:MULTISPECIES: GGDEF domain-containing protein [unclassified Colwellia]MBA6292307.1 diguanylate cyclase [Colwellia sp. MB3u-8]MBA6305813.1 diguanylate cyclase [Colwellia sp. MB3u-70]